MGKIDFDALRKEVEAEFPDKPKKPYFKWSREQTEQLVSLIDEQKTVPEIAAVLGVPEDKVHTKLKVLRAKVPGVKKAKSAPVPAETAPKAQDAPAAADKPAEPVADLDRLVFRAFDTLVGKVDDFDRMADCWREALRLIEKQLDGCAVLLRQHPDTEEHLAVIAAIVAYDELRA